MGGTIMKKYVLVILLFTLFISFPFSSASAEEENPRIVSVDNSK